jgi:hypothetical protein
MGACLLSRRFLAAILVVLAPGIGRGQTLNIDRSLKNIPTEPVPAVEPTPPPAVQSSTPASPAAETRVEPQRLRPAGTYTNKFSRVPFPKQVADFTRLNVDMYDGEGRNIGAVYEKKQRGNLVCVVNAFSYPFPARGPAGGAAAIFEREKLAITSRQQGARLIREEPFRAPDGSIGDFAELEFSVGKPATLVRSRLYLFAGNDWLLKIQVSYGAARAREGAADGDVFLRTFGTAPVRSQTGN